MKRDNETGSPTAGIPILSFFTGGGFLDMGFEQLGFNTVWTNEIDPALADMYEFAMTAWRNSSNQTLQDARISSRLSITELNIQDIMHNAFGRARPPLFGVVGGPPCVDFCMGGKNRGANGNNGKLLSIFADMIKGLRPDFFVIENVPGLWNTKKHKSFLRRVVKKLKDKPNKYRVATRIVSALELGVPQDRERIFIVGFTEELFKIYHRKNNISNPAEWFRWPKAIYPNAKKLPWPDTSPFGGTPELPEELPLNLTVNTLLAGPPDPETLPNGEEFFRPYSSKFNQVEEGDDSRKSFKRLHRYRYSPTVWYGNNEVHLHPWKPRRLSVREALRIQTVPDTYVLPEEYPLTAKFKLIANGVPCELSKAIARSVMQFLPVDTEKAAAIATND